MITIILLILGGIVLSLSGFYLLKRDDSLKGYLIGGAMMIAGFGVFEIGIFFFAIKYAHVIV